MGVQPPQRQLRVRQDRLNGQHRRAIGEGEPELLILMSRCDELVGVRLHSDSYSDQDVDHDPMASGDLCDPLDLDQGIHHDATHPARHREFDLLDRLIAAVQDDAARLDPSGQRHHQLPTGARVDPQALLAHPAGHCRREQCLRRVVRIDGKLQIVIGGEELPCPQTDIGLVEDIQR